MPDDTLTTSWKRSTDKVRTPGGASVHRSLAEASRTLRQEAQSCPLSPSSHPHAGSAGAAPLTERNGEAIRQAATLAAWEDEGGTTVFDD